MFDVLSIGNAIVDMIADVEHDFLDTNGLTKGSMMLVDAEESTRRRGLLGTAPVRLSSGGSAANTAAAIASLGGRSAYIGKVASDDLGVFFRQDMQGIGVHIAGQGNEPSAPTANCLAMITPDGERTMSTFLGACQELDRNDVDPRLSDTRLIFLEGYLLDAPRSNGALWAAAHAAKRDGCKVALTLSDRYCVQRNRGQFMQLVGKGVIDVLIGNETEVEEFLTDFPVAYLGRTKLVVTLGSKGSTVVDKDGTKTFAAAAPVPKVVDLIGAGDAFAAGFLYGYVRGLQDAQSLALGNRTAAVVVESKGARPHTPLTTVLADFPGLLVA